MGRISDVLNKQLININDNGINLKIEGGHELKGEITLKKSKNAAVGLLCASLLNHGVTELNHFHVLKKFFGLLKYWKVSACR